MKKKNKIDKNKSTTIRGIVLYLIFACIIAVTLVSITGMLLLAFKS